MGSLFKARDWWSTRCGDAEEYDRGCLAVGNVDNDMAATDKIVTGSFQGTLRVYHPRQKGFKPDDLLLEQHLEQPIMQLAIGKFGSSSSSNHLAILHPKKLVVCTVQKSGGSGSDSHDPLRRQYTLTRLYEHILDRISYNFVNGNFGKTGKDNVCVQTMDGQMVFYEQEKFYFSRFLSNPSGSERSFLLPGHLCYAERTDSFITNTSAFEVESYRYSTLVSSSGSEAKEGSDGGRKLRCDWSVNVGEDVIDIRMVQFARSSGVSVDIVALGERTLFLLKDTGEILQQRRLEYFPSCMLPYGKKGRDGDQNLMVGTHSSSVMIYDEAKLVWSAKASVAPVAMQVISAAKVDGLIVLLSDNGALSCNYLGTDPAMQPTQLLDSSRELDYNDMDEEHRQLQQLIRQAVNAGKAEPDDSIVLQYECPSQLDASSTETGKYCTVRLHLSYTGSEAAEHVVLTVNVPQPFTLPSASLVVDRVEGGGAPVMVPLTFMLNTDPSAAALTPTSLQAEVVCCYSSPAGEPLTSRCSFILPMSLAGSVIPPVKNTAYKITLETNHPPPPLQHLFDDVAASSSEGASPHALSFQYSNSSDATILVSKNANRYRLQASHFESLWLLTAELVRRLKIFYAAQGGEPLHVRYTDSIPFTQYFEAIDAHFEARLKVESAQQNLSERAHQFRSIQKRLLVRFKDRNPSPLSNLDRLFEETYRTLLKISEEVESHQEHLAKCSNQLVCSTHLVLLLIQHKFDMRKDEFKLFKNYLSPIVSDSSKQGWEECTDAAMTHLLRTALAKTYKEAMSMPQPLQMPADTSKLKKHIALVCDRLSKGGSLRNDKPPTQGKEGGGGGGGEKEK